MNGIGIGAGGVHVLLATDVSSHADTDMGKHQWCLARELERHGFYVREMYEDAVPAGSWRPARRFRFPWAVLREVRREASTGRPYDFALVHEGSAGLLCFARRQGLVPTVCVAVSHNPEQKVWEYALEYASRGAHSVSLKSRVLWPATRLWQSNLALRCADHVLCLSEEDREFVTRRYGLAPARVTRIANGASPDCFLGARPAGPPRILFLGSWIPLKGVAELRHALAVVLARHPEALASLVGVGLPVETLLKEFPVALHSRISVRSHFLPAELPAVLQMHNIFVLPSWWEGMPIALLEAMAAGLAPVVTCVGGMRDVVRDDVEGIWVPPGDSSVLAGALDRLCIDQELRARMGAAAAARAEHYTWERSGQQLSTVLRTLMAISRPVVPEVGSQLSGQVSQNG